MLKFYQNPVLRKESVVALGTTVAFLQFLALFIGHDYKLSPDQLSALATFGGALISRQTVFSHKTVENLLEDVSESYKEDVKPQHLGEVGGDPI